MESLLGSLKNRAFNSLAWVLTGTSIIAVFRLINLIILARFVSLEDFGLIEAAMVVVGFARFLCEMGIGSALVQKRELSSREKQAVYTFALYFGLILGSAVFYGRFFISSLFRMPDLAPLLQILAIVSVLHSLCLLSSAMLQRDLRFGILVRIEVISYILGHCCVSIALAMAGFGVWALVVGVISEAVIRSLMLLLINRTALCLYLDISALRPFIRFGSGMTIARIANFVATKGDNIIVGRMLGAEALGIYSRSYQLAILPASLLGEVFSRVLFPSFSRIQDNEKSLREYFRRSISIVGLLILPSSCLTILLTPELVNLFLGSKWTNVIFPLQILTCGLLFHTSYKVSDALARAYGAVYRRAGRQAIYALLVLSGTMIGQYWGLPGVSVGVLVAISVNFFLMLQLSRQIISITWREIGIAHLPAVRFATICCGTGGIVVMLLRILGMPAIITILGCVTITGVIAVSVTMSYPKFLGPDAAWMLRSVKEHLPQNISGWLLRMVV
jgi:O-antigen/teichoic acid export membrane protein